MFIFILRSTFFVLFSFEKTNTFYLQPNKEQTEIIKRNRRKTKKAKRIQNNAKERKKYEKRDEKKSTTKFSKLKFCHKYHQMLVVYQGLGSHTPLLLLLALYVLSTQGNIPFGVSVCFVLFGCLCACYFVCFSCRFVGVLIG
jgi:hypothetical protein